jgi:hypothetical protein
LLFESWSSVGRMLLTGIAAYAAPAAGAGARVLEGVRFDEGRAPRAGEDGRAVSGDRDGA